MPLGPGSYAKPFSQGLTVVDIAMNSAQQTLTTNDLYFSSVASKRKLARQIYTQWGQQMLAQADIQQSLSRLELLSKKLHTTMSELVMFSLCVECGSRPDGGCCSAFMAGETDAIQLVLNLLFGKQVEVQRQDDKECCYLGPEGCIFALKPFFCLNYNCQQILNDNKAAKLQAYLTATGQLLQEQTALEERVLSFLKNKGALVSS